MKINFSDKKQGVIGIAGHVGCGHAHSLNNQVQDDSVGLSVVLSLFKEATNISLRIKEFKFEGNRVTAVLESGGQGYGIARRGISTQEQNMINGMVGSEVINTHTLVLEHFGRIYGQGILETPVAVQAAIANAALNTFVINFPEQFQSVVEDVADNYGNIVGTVLDMDGIPVSVLGTVNATKGGIGPNEDLEGNSPNYSKKEIIESLALDKIPTLIIEAMVSSSFSEGLTENTYFVRADEEDDNIEVLKATIKACKDLSYPVKHHVGGMKRTVGALRANTQKVGEKVIELGEKLKVAETSEDKVNIIAELALVVSQDCGGISFMTNELHEQIGGAGMIKRTSAVINLVVTPDYPLTHPIPFVTEKECEEYVNITKQTVRHIYENLEAATRIVQG